MEVLMKIIYIWGIFQHMFTLEGTCCLCHSKHLGSLHRWLAILGLDSLRESWDKTLHFYIRLHSELLSDIETSAQMCRVHRAVWEFVCISLDVDRSSILQHSVAAESGSTEQLQDLWPLDPWQCWGQTKKRVPCPLKQGRFGWFDQTSKNHHRTYMSSFLFEDSLSSCHIMSILHHASIIF